MGRMTSELQKEISTTQDKVLSSFADVGKPVDQMNDQIIKTLAEFDDKTAAGKVLRRFAALVSPRHPDVVEYTKFPEWNDFSRETQPVDADKLDKVYKPIVRNMAHIKPRLVDDPLKRSDFREAKRQVKHVSMKQVYMMGENGFYGKPDNFEMCVRNSKNYVDEIASLKVQQEVFVSHGMNEVANTVKKRIASLEEMRDECYLGFHRLKPSDAAVISARQHGLKWHELHFLTVPFKYFELSYWSGSVADRKEEERNKDELKKLLVMKDKKLAFVDSVAFTYQPRLYPLAKFGIMPKEVTEVITKVESMPELNGCPVFDYYWVLMPSININHPYFRQKDGWKVRVRRQEAGGWTDLELKSYTDEYDAAFALDQTLMCDGYFAPVVLGERDGKCYFLSIWR